MAVASPVDVAVNPNDTDQRYILWGNGRIDAIGGAVPITGGPSWYDWIDQPVAVAIHITDWATGRGYLLDLQGGFHALNGAPDLFIDHDADPNTHDQVPGVPYTDRRKYVDWAWNPSGNGQGYVLDVYGQFYPFGGATPPPRTGPRFPWPVARKLAMRFTPDVRAITMDLHGGLHGDFAQPAAINVGNYWPGWDAARDLQVTDWATPSGYVLDLFGLPNPFGGAPNPAGYPYLPHADVARTLTVLSPADPVRFWEVWSGGQQFEWTASTPPTVIAGGIDPVSPAATVTGTTRPMLAWTYTDPQRDSQTAWELYVFSQAFVDSHSMTDPGVWTGDALVADSGINPGTRGVASPVDLPNGAYRMYVRAQDTAGQWSAWSTRGWTQNVPVPTAPTGLTATANEATFSVALSATATTGEAANLLRFVWSDDPNAATDPDSVTWYPVDGGDAVPLAATTTAIDRFPPPGVQRTYRAVSYAVDPAVASAPSNIATATMTRLDYLLHAVDNPTLGGIVPAVDPSEWTRPVAAGVFQGVGADYPTVVSDGQPKARRTTLRLITHDRAEWEAVKALAESDSVLVYRDPFGEVIYCRLVGDWGRSQLPAAPLAGEVTPLRHMHSTDLPLVEVRPPHLAG